MTHASKSPVRRVVTTTRGDLVVTITGEGLLIRRKGSRTTYGPIAFTAIEDMGAKLHAAEKLAKRRPRTRSRNVLKLSVGV